MVEEENLKLNPFYYIFDLKIVKIHFFGGECGIICNEPYFAADIFFLFLFLNTKIGSYLTLKLIKIKV